MKTCVIRLADGSIIRLKAEEFSVATSNAVYVRTSTAVVGVFPTDGLMGCWFEDSEEEPPQYEMHATIRLPGENDK